MKPVNAVSKLSRYTSYIAAVILVLVPFHAFITVWLASQIGHYTLLRLWKEYLLVLVLLGAAYVLATDRGLRQRLFKLWAARLIAVYALVLVLAAVAARVAHHVTAKAMWYGLLVDLRFLVFFLAVLIVAAKSDFLANNRKKLLLLPALVVACFAILQYLVLPYDFLRHFGYGSNTILPYETINSNIHHLRVISTLRGANPLGAYLIVPICAVAAYLISEKWRRADKALFGIGLAAALVFSFSRSAWIGVCLGVVCVVGLSLKSSVAKARAAWALAALVVVAVAVALTLRNNASFESVFLHTQHDSTVATTSNEYHASAFKTAVSDIARAPLGGGVGTAGPQSAYNNRPIRIAEDYYLQIGQEAGVIGMALFVAICASVGWLLYNRRNDPFAVAMLAALVGLAFVNILSHAWEDDTLAYVFWGLSAIALSPVILTNSPKAKNGKIKKPQTSSPVR